MRYAKGAEVLTATGEKVGKGFLLKEHNLVPTQWVELFKDEKFYLSVEARLFERLSDYTS